MFSWFTHKTSSVYLDYAAATPVRTAVLRSMAPFWQDQFANPGAIHSRGICAREAIANARAALARILRIRTDDIYFTGSGTESNNIALLGTIEERFSRGIPYAQMEVITTNIEHASILSVCAYLSTKGVVIHYAPLTPEGIIDTQALSKLINQYTVALATAYVNSEIGVIQPLSHIARIARRKEKEYGTRIYVIADGAQAPLWLPCALDTLGVDIVTLDAGKCYGPKGIGVLAKRHTVVLAPILFGGGQERSLRSGTENTPLIVGASHALCIAQEGYKVRAEKVLALRDACIQELVTTISGIHINGSLQDRVANNIHISIEGIESEFAAVTLSLKGIACATKSACGGARGDGSSVVRTLTDDDARAKSTLRFTLGEETTQAELSHMIKILAAHVAKTRAAQAKLTIRQ